MAFQFQSAQALNYAPCRYGKSKLIFRGPRRKLAGDYVVAIGGSETYGKYVADPWPQRLEQRIGTRVVNLGYMNAGLDVFLHDPAVIEACAGARTTVIQLMAPQNMSNRFYAVHPRRNDRFLSASEMMRTLFREVDFAEFHFTGHMLQRLEQVSAEKFALVEQELRAAWMARMALLLSRIPGEKVLLWLEPPVQDGFAPAPPGRIDDAMVEALRPLAAGIIRVTPSPEARRAGTLGMIYPELDAPVAACLPSPLVHAEVAAALVPLVSTLI